MELGAREEYDTGEPVTGSPVVYHGVRLRGRNYAKMNFAPSITIPSTSTVSMISRLTGIEVVF